MSDLLCIEICFLSLLPSVCLLLPYLSVCLSYSMYVCMSVCFPTTLLSVSFPSLCVCLFSFYISFNCLATSFSVCLYVYLLVFYISLHLSIDSFSVCLLICPFFFPPFYHSVSLFLCLSVCLFVISSTNEIV